MKKYSIFFLMIFIVITFNTCTLPSYADIKGTAKLKVSASMDVSKLIKELMNGLMTNGADDYTLYECPNAVYPDGEDYLTYLLHMKIPAISIDFTGINKSPLVIDGVDHFNIDDDFDLIIDYIDLPLDELSNGLGDTFDGFNFNTNLIKSRIYLNGPDIVQAISIDLVYKKIIADVKIEEDKIRGNDKLIHLRESDIAENEEHLYNKPSLTEGSADISIAKIINTEEKVKMEYHVFLAKNTQIKSSWLDSAGEYITFEMAIWLPMSFKAEGDKTTTALTGQRGAEFVFPDGFLDGVGGFIEPYFSMMNSFSMGLEMIPNPFKNGYLIIRNEGYIDIPNAMTQSSLNIAFTEEQIAKFADPNTPKFKPKLSIFIKNNDTLDMSRDIKIMSVSLNAKLKVRVDLGKESDDPEKGN